MPRKEPEPRHGRLARMPPSPRRDAFDEADLLAEVRDLYEVLDPVPAETIAAAQASLNWLQAGVEIAEITRDSAADDTAPALNVRTRGGGRLLAFESSEANVIVEVREEGGRRRVLGQISGCLPAEIDVRHTSGVRIARADRLGRFRADDLPSGPVSFACTITPAKRLVTDWVSI